MDQELVLTLEDGEAAERQRRLSGGRFSIGRAVDNDWVLPDPERVLSKHHCLIERRGGEWLLTDTSSNGVYVGGSAEPLGPGRSVPLRDGLHLQLGGYVLGVRLAAATFGADAPPAEARPHAHGGGDPFDVSWFRGKPLDAPTHPVRADGPAPPPFTRPDHAPVDEVSLDLPRRRSPFDEPLPASPAPPAAPTASVLLDPDWGSSLAQTAAAPPATDPPPPEPPASAPPPPPPPPIQAAAAAVGGDDAARLCQAFLAGAGLAAGEAAGLAQDPEQLLGELGRRYRMLAGGLVELLRLRAALKRETGLDLTMIAAAGNNPLKLTATADEAVRWLVCPRGAGYLAPEPAIAAALDDLKAFMPELVQAMQQALRNLLRRFDPADLERELADASLLEILAAGGRKARYWELFKERYGELARHAEAEFLREVGVDVVRGRGASRREDR